MRQAAFVTKCAEAIDHRIGKRESAASEEQVHCKVNTAKTFDSDDTVPINTIKQFKADNSFESKFAVTLIINGRPVTIIIDTCAKVSIVSSAQYNKLCRTFLCIALRLRYYGEKDIATLGICNVVRPVQRARTKAADCLSCVIDGARPIQETVD